MNRLSVSVAAALTLLAAGAQAQTVIFSEDFESFASQVANGGYTVVNANSNVLNPWTVGSASVDLVRNAFGAINGVSVDLAGTPGPGTLSRTFNAVAGMTYTLSFDHFRNGGGTAMTVSFGGTTTTYGVPTAVAHDTLSWTATASGVQTISFGSGAGNLGATLDNVVLTAVPEPTSYALLLAGVGVLGALSRRRRA
ncbi:PEP-CTERM sorting domain-containing protein [Roseateles sp. BYS180W]|uniref:PEP-CTERM sorting domain-containing protein n=1 Tax=Roseateles rivi TaxID=3299028 RepID=A0ABW7FTY9_9BURK